MRAFEEVTIEGAENAFPVQLFRSSDQLPALLIVVGPELEATEYEPWLAALVTRRRSAMLFDPAASQPHLAALERGARAEAIDDRLAILDLGACRDRMARELPTTTEVAVVGLGSGGTLAFLLACRRDDLFAAVMLSGRVSYPELSAHRAIQPLDVAVGLDCPLLCIHGRPDPLASDAELARFEFELNRACRHVEIVRPDSTRPVPKADNSSVEWVLSFLSEFASGD